jgi:hypothetical protein
LGDQHLISALIGEGKKAKKEKMIMPILFNIYLERLVSEIGKQ